MTHQTPTAHVVSFSGGKEEEWRPVVGFENAYEVSKSGRVRRIGGDELRPHKRPGGYATVCLCVGGRPRTRSLHRVVAEAFLPVTGNEVNHLDGDKHNNAVSNLEWTTRSGNNAHAYRQLNRTPVRSNLGKCGAAHARSKAVVGTEIATGVTIEFASTRLASAAGFTQSAVAACARGEKVSYRGYTWKYKGAL